MNSHPIRLEGQYFDGNRPIAAPAVLMFAGAEVTLTAGLTTDRYSIRQLSISPRIGRADRFISMPNGGQFQCPDNPFLDSLPQESPSEGRVAWLEERWGVALAGVAVIAAILLVGYFYGLPATANRVASRIPMETERKLGRQALVWLDSNKTWFKPTFLEQDVQNRIRNGFNELIRNLPFEKCYQLEFRDSPIGPNAFALPGGIIVITDDLVNTADSREEVLAVLAHEIGHAELRHSMKSVFQSSVIAVVSTMVTGDAASLSATLSGLPALLAETKYSRKFETEADDFAFKLLKKQNLSPAAFASLMERLLRENKGKKSAFSFLSTHPVTAERIKRARAAAER